MSGTGQAVAAIFPGQGAQYVGMGNNLDPKLFEQVSLHPMLFALEVYLLLLLIPLEQW